MKKGKIIQVTNQLPPVPAAERMLALLEQCAKLPPESIRVLELHYLEEIPLKDISTILGKSLSTIRNYHNRGIFLLQQYLDGLQKN